MAAHRGRVSRPTQAQDLAEIQRMNGQLVQGVQNLSREQPEVQNETPENNQIESEEEEEYVNPFHDSTNHNQPRHGGT